MLLRSGLLTRNRRSTLVLRISGLVFFLGFYKWAILAVVLFRFTAVLSEDVLHAAILKPALLGSHLYDDSVVLFLTRYSGIIFIPRNSSHGQRRYPKRRW
jgi:hypothetical protein